MKSHKKSRLKAFLNAFYLALSVLLMALGSSWLADSLYPVITEQGYPPGLGLAVGLATFITGTVLAYRLRRTFLPVRVLSQNEEIEPHRALVIPVSNPYGDWENLSKNLEAAMKGQETNWQQILRTIHPHLETLEEIHLIGSAGTKPSYEKLEECADFIERYFKHVKIERYDKPVPFEDIAALTQAVNDIIGAITQRRENPIDRKDIMLDATGGTKTVSIAMAMVTTHYPDLQFQYVTTGDDPHPIAFNVVTETQVELG